MAARTEKKGFQGKVNSQLHIPLLLESFSFWCQPTAYVLGLTLFLAPLQVTEHILQSPGQSSQATLSPLPGGCQAGKDARETTGARSKEECPTTAIAAPIPR